MARRLCKYGCGNEVAHNAKTCPKCGGRKPHPTTFSDVVRGIIGFAAVLAIVWSQCEPKAEEEKKTADTQQAADQAGGQPVEQAAEKPSEQAAKDTRKTQDDEPRGMGIAYAAIRALLGEFLQADQEKPGGRFAMSKSGIAVLDVTGPVENITGAGLAVGFPIDRADLAEENREMLRRFLRQVCADWPEAGTWAFKAIDRLAGRERELTRVARGRTIKVGYSDALKFYVVTVSGAPLAQEVRDGQRIVERALGAFPRLHAWYRTPHMLNPLYHPKAGLHLPTAAWNTLTENEKKSVCAFVASYVPEMKRYPFDFTDIPPDAPAAPMITKAVRAMGADDWEITTGPLSEDALDVVPSETVASGAADEGTAGK